MTNERSPNEFDDAPLLGSIPKLDPFVVPDGFFDQFPHQVQSNILLAQERNTRMAWMQFLFKPALIGSFSVVVLALLGWWAWQPAEQQPTAAQHEIAREAEFLMVEDIEEPELYALFASSDNTMADVDLSLDDDVLIDYLENEDLSLYFLTEEL